MKVLIVRLVSVGCLTFLVVFCSVYAINTPGTHRSSRSNHTSNSDRTQRTQSIEGHERTEGHQRSGVQTATLTQTAQTAEEAERESKVTRTAVRATPAPAQPKAAADANADGNADVAADANGKVAQPDTSWFQGTREEREIFQPLLRGRRAPALEVNQWTNTTPLHPKLREDKIVVLAFWSTWCQPCLNSINFNNELYRHYKDRDVVVIGICNTDGSEDMAEIVKSRDIEYPVAIDDPGDKSVSAYQVQALPTYFVIDREGRLRFADIKRNRVDDAIEYLLSRD